MHPSPGMFVTSGTGGDRCAATGVQKRRQAFVNPLDVLMDAYDFPRIIDSQDDDAAIGIRERAYRFSDGRQISQAALELRVPTFAFVDALKDVNPFHVQDL